MINWIFVNVFAVLIPFVLHKNPNRITWRAYGLRVMYTWSSCSLKHSEICPSLSVAQGCSLLCHIMVMQCTTPNFNVILFFVWISKRFGYAITLPSVCSTGNSSNPVVTASYAVFTEDRRVPLAVVGYQFQHLRLLSEFKSITSKVNLETFKNNIIMIFCVITSSPCLRFYIFNIKISGIKLYKSRNLFF